jgi:hypothetical protein
VHLDATCHDLINLPADSFCPLRKLIVLTSAFVYADLHAFVDVVDRLPGQHKPLIIPPFDSGLQGAQDGPLILALVGDAKLFNNIGAKKSFVTICIMMLWKAKFGVDVDQICV